MTDTLTHGQAMDAVEAAFTAKATNTHGVVNFSERAHNTFYAARMLTGYTGGSYPEAVAALAREFTTAEAIDALPGRALRARA